MSGVVVSIAICTFLGQRMVVVVVTMIIHTPASPVNGNGWLCGHDHRQPFLVSEYDHHPFPCLEKKWYMIMTSSATHLCQKRNRMSGHSICTFPRGMSVYGRDHHQHLLHHCMILRFAPIQSLRPFPSLSPHVYNHDHHH